MRAESGGFNFKEDFSRLRTKPEYRWTEGTDALVGRLVMVFFTVNLWVNNGIASPGTPLSTFNRKSTPPATNVSLNLMDIGVLE